MGYACCEFYYDLNTGLDKFVYLEGHEGYQGYQDYKGYKGSELEVYDGYKGLESIVFF